MAVYQFTCEEHGGIEIRAAMGAAPSTLPCPDCGEGARRVFSAPMLTRTSGALTAAFERAERGAEAPDVVTSPPPRAARTRPQRHTHDPKHRRLPRP